jgi:predicted DNA-binding transcriptional regulator YafY
MKQVSRPMLSRLRTIVLRLSRRERVTAGILAKSLEVSQRTIARDLDYLANGLELPISYDFQLKSYVLNGPIPSILSINPKQED